MRVPRVGRSARDWEGRGLSTGLAVTNALVTRFPAWAKGGFPFGVGPKTDATRTDSQGGFTMPSQRHLYWVHLDRGFGGTLEVCHEGYATIRVPYVNTGGYSARFSSEEPKVEVGDIAVAPKPR
jgi:hypothetical protein